MKSFQEIILTKNSPRNINLFPYSFSKGLKLYRFFAYFFFVGSLFIILISIAKFRMFFPGILFIIIAIGTLFMIKNVTLKIKNRKDVFVNGNIVNAKVVAFSKAFNFLKSTPDYTITVLDLKNNINIKLVYKNKIIWKECPIDKIITGLEFNDNYFFAEEMGNKFIAEEKIK